MVAAVENQHLLTRLADNRYRLGMWVALAGITMLFTGLTSAYIVRTASSTDWQPLATPSILFLSTAVIIISSGTLEIARRSLKAKFTGRSPWLLLTLLFGVGFLSSQLLAWRQLARQGVYLASNPHSSFFYLLTATHGFHLLGGLLALGYLIIRIHQRRSPYQQVTTKDYAIFDAVALYWHFMDALWIYLFLLLFFWR
jgi:cytochrome c oxidase subunit 3